ncbi:MAG: shikimate dehydrogenase [Bacteroidales bacterium]|nr:shikimate dehydrogenase [Bacteroidales bacterium]
MKKFGLIGFPLTVSFSKDYFENKFACENLNDHIYELFPLTDISKFPEFLKKHSNLCGLNVTIPHKKTVMPYLDELDESASNVGAVNVIKFKKNGRSVGYNSDVFGFEQSFLPLLNPHHRSALILGTGGAAMAVAFVLRKHNIPYQFVSRQKTEKALTYQDIYNDRHSREGGNPRINKGFAGQARNDDDSFNIIINTTPLGMTPNVDTTPDLPYEKITSDFLCYDLVYTPKETLFLKKSKAQGAVIKNGLEMLHLQAERAWEIWSD